MQTVQSERTKLYLDGVSAAITADIARRRHDGMVVTQALPFLRLDTSVTGHDGRRARISRVAIAMDGDVPRLLLELMNEDHDESLDESLDELLSEPPPGWGHAPALASAALDGALETDASDDTLESFTPGMSARPPRPDGTMPYELQRREQPPEEVVLRDVPEVAPRLPAPHVSWPMRLLVRLLAFVASLGRSAAPLLPR